MGSHVMIIACALSLDIYIYIHEHTHTLVQINAFAVLPFNLLRSEDLPQSRKIADDVYKLFIRNENSKKLICLKQNKRQILQLAPKFAEHSRAIPFMLQILADLPLSQEALQARKAEFIKDLSLRSHDQEFESPDLQVWHQSSGSFSAKS